MYITARIIAHSKSAITGREIVTFELEYPRFIHSELMTHRVFSRNAASSRAIPVQKIIDMVAADPAMPVHWGANKPGMQADAELTGFDLEQAQKYWKLASEFAVECADGMRIAGAHKQIVNRILEPFQWMKTVVTATSFDNFFWLRKHPDAQPEIKRLAEEMWEALQASEPVVLEVGDWHVPYFGGNGVGYWLSGCGIPLTDALAISASCCAQVSYRTLDASLEKAQDIYARLVESEPVHASPFEHQATPVDYPPCVDITELSVIEGATHIDADGHVWSGNFKDWIQHRQLIPNNVCNNYKESVGGGDD